MPLSVPPMVGYTMGSLGVTQHPARWSPDFPLSRILGTAVTRSAWPHKKSNISSGEGQATNPIMGLANVEDSTATVAQYRLAPHPCPLELMSGKGHAAATTQPPLHFSDSQAAFGGPEALVQF